MAANNKTTDSGMQKAIERITRETLGLETLEARNSDELDFHDMAVWQIREPLEAAYRAGASRAR
jgi:hypothetical protein